MTNKITVWVPCKGGTPWTRGNFPDETEAWDWIKELEAYGPDREYSYTKNELKKQGFDVQQFELTPVMSEERK